nr:PREDICTED: uncharacterized protein LOC109037981 [Bemisia tabaci]XP_018908437.1 PREDICTED: uncharacterized protein LOC109037981 [Bemisia tabaci]
MSLSRMVALFVGHGSPMNGIEKNRYTESWQKAGESLPRPRAILAISAHWFTEGAAVTAMENPRTIYDFYGFPKALYKPRYPAPGSVELAKQVAELLSPVSVQMDQEWGFDHGAWTVLINMYPKADIPVVQLSLDITKPPAWHFEMGQKLAPLRDQGVMIVASGNVVHNLRKLKWDWKDGDDVYPWAVNFNKYVRENLNVQMEAKDHPLVNFMKHEYGKLSVPTSEHYLPLLYVLGAHHPDEPVSILVDGMEGGGAISMLSVQFG